MRRVIEQYLEDLLAEKLLLNPGKGSNWQVSAEGDKLQFTELEPPREEKAPLALTGPSEPTIRLQIPPKMSEGLRTLPLQGTPVARAQAPTCCLPPL